MNVRILVAAAIIFTIASCSKTNKQGRYVPQEAAVVLHIDGKTMSEKLPWDEVKKNPAFEMIKADSSIPLFIQKAFDNPDNAGIDVNNDIIIFLTKDERGAYFCVQGHIKDAEKFKLFNIDVTKNGFETKKGDVTYITAQPVVAGFNKNMFAYVVDAPYTLTGDDKYSRRNKPRLSRDLPGTCENVFNLSAGKSMGENEKFTELVKQNDVHVWLNMEQILKANSAMEDIPFGDISKLYEGNIATVAVNFENGKVSLKTKNYYSKEITSLYKKYTTDNFDEAMVKNIPAKNVAAFMAMNIKPAAVQEMMKLANMESMVNIAMLFMGFSLDDLSSALKGDFMVAIGDFKVKTDTVKNYFEPGKFEVRNKVEPDMLLAASVKDKDALHKLNKGFDKLKKRSGFSDIDDTNESAFTAQNDSYFAFSTSQQMADDYIKGGNGSFDFLTKLKDNPLGAYANLQEIIKAAQLDIPADDTAWQKTATVALKYFKDVYMWGGKYDGGGFVTNIEINMNDNSSNSLKQINIIAAEIIKIQIEEEKKREERFKNLKFTPPVIKEEVIPITEPALAKPVTKK